MDLRSICTNVCELADTTGKFILSQRDQFRDGHIEIKGHNNFVSYVDKTSEEKIVNALQKLIPESGFIAEEGTSNKKGTTYNWIIDPLDGTTNFIHGIPCFSISIALMREDQLVLGVIHEPNLNECFHSFEGGKALMNKTEISVSKKSSLKDSLIATGFPYTDYSRMKEYMGVFNELMHKSHGVRRLGSAAVDLAYVACGRFELFYEYGLQPWDVAAGAFLIKQAGGEVTDFKGGSNYVFGEEIITSNKITHMEFLSLLNQHFT